MPVEVQYVLAGTVCPVIVDEVALELTVLVAELKDLIKAAHPRELQRFDSKDLKLFLVPLNLARECQRQLQQDKIAQDLVRAITNAAPPMMAEHRLQDVSADLSLQVLVVATDKPERASFVLGAVTFFAGLPLVELADTNWLSFFSCIPWTNQHKMLVRQCFREIADEMMELAAPHQPKHFVISGSAGVGKSFFLWYFMWRLVQAKRRVLLMNSDAPVYFDGITMWTFSSLPREQDHCFWSSDLMCLVDFVGDCSEYEGPFTRVHTSALICSRFSHKDDIFDKILTSPEVYYLPLWDETEMEEVAGLLARSEESSWRLRFHVLGGIPRVVFVEGDDPERELMAGCYSCSSQDFGVYGITPITQASHLLIHMASKKPYRSFQYESASNDGCRVFMRWKWELKRQELLPPWGRYLATQEWRCMGNRAES